MLQIINKGQKLSFMKRLAQNIYKKECCFLKKIDHIKNGRQRKHQTWRLIKIVLYINIGTDELKN